MKTTFKKIILLLCTSMIMHKGYTTEPASLKTIKKPRNRSTKRFHLNFTNKPLIDLIDELASEKGINYILPQGSFAIPPTTTITYHLPKPVGINEAWQQLIAILEIAGYTINPEGDFLAIKKIDKQIVTKQPFEHIYLDEPLKNIPDTEQIIRAIFYLKNLNISSSWNDLNAIFTDMLSTTADIRSDGKTNSIILTDKACNIKSVMKIIQELDKGGMRDSIEVLPLYYISASMLDDLFNQKLLALKPSTPGAATPEQIGYFPKNTKVIGLARTNSLVIMGTPYAIDLVKDFVIKYLDRPLESGESILHVYELQYLNAETFAGTLQTMVTPAPEQATGKVITGAKQYFRDVIVRAEKIGQTEAITPSAIGGESTGGVQPTSQQATLGGNRLIIAARKKDWIRIEKLIKELDKPQPQVALEVLVVDIVLVNNRFLGHQMRNRQGFNDSVSKNINFQSAQISQPILKSINPDIALTAESSPLRPADALMANLLQVGDPFAAGVNIANNATAGSLIISFQDNKESGVWSVWQLLNQYTTGTILAQPFIVTQNHKQASVSISQDRYLPGSVDTSNVSAAVKQEWVKAALTVDILPHISATGNINLQITVNVNEFVSAANNRISRLVQTNANIGDQEILALGGLTRTIETIDNTHTPLLGKIPVLGWFFKKQQKAKEKNNLIVLICPTIIEPKALGGVDTYSSRKLDFAKDDLNTHLSFENLKDPITRWFFKPDPCFAEKTITNYTQKTIEEKYDSDLLNNRQETTENNVITQQETEQLKTLLHHEENPLNSQEVKRQVDLR
jgi:general secretion pathway protein D